MDCTGFLYSGLSLNALYLKYMLLNCTALNASAIDNTALNALSALQSRNATDSSTQLLPPLLPLLLHTNQHCIPTRYNKIQQDKEYNLTGIPKCKRTEYAGSWDKREKKNFSLMAMLIVFKRKKPS